MATARSVDPDAWQAGGEAPVQTAAGVTESTVWWWRGPWRTVCSLRCSRRSQGNAGLVEACVAAAVGSLLTIAACMHAAASSVSFLIAPKGPPARQAGEGVSLSSCRVHAGLAVFSWGVAEWARSRVKETNM
jgi:hypothetical protein